MQSMRSFALLGILICACGCTHYRFDIPVTAMREPGIQIWGVNLKRSGESYRSTSVTMLNGSQVVREKPTSIIASGRSGFWEWEVRAAPSLVPSYRAWVADKKVQQRSASPDDWSHPAANWAQGFDRAYKVVSYLLGRAPVPAKITLLLVPEGSSYQRKVVATGTAAIPLTLAFYYPSDSSSGEKISGERFSALVDAVSRTAYEYQHFMDDSGLIVATGKTDTDKTINDEARSQCWMDSVVLALTSGTHSESTWAVAPNAIMKSGPNHEISLGDAGANETGREKPYSQAVYWGQYLEVESVSQYLRSRGMRDSRVSSKDSDGMNAVLSVCRAMTQHPEDLTQAFYPPGNVEYQPFFPKELSDRP